MTTSWLKPPPGLTEGFIQRITVHRRARRVKGLTLEDVPIYLKKKEVVLV